MSQSRLAYLIKVYFNKTTTPDERDELISLLMHSENDDQVKTLLTDIWQDFNSQNKIFSNSQGDEMLANILQKEKADKEPPVIVIHKRSFNWLHIAAAVIICVTAMGIYFLLKPQKPSQQIAQSKISPATIKPTIAAGGNKAMLTLSDGSSIMLDSTHQGTLAKQGNVKIVKVNIATLAYNTGEAKTGVVVYNTLSTPIGGEYQLILPDGSKVWLNASSSIHFPTVFTGNERKVTVTGEAYFEVAKNAAMPFKINVKDMEVVVLGTHFNIMAYDDESSMNTTLLEGSVKVTKGTIVKMLMPGQQSIINKTGEIKITDADVEEVMAWKNGWFQFDAYDIKTIMRQISRWYNVEIVYEGKVPEGHFSGLVSRNNDIFQVLKIMQSAGVKFKIDGRKLIVLA